MALTQDEVRKLKKDDVLWVIKQKGKGRRHFVGTAQVIGIVGCCLLGLSTLSKGDAYPTTDGRHFVARFSELTFPFE
jgi:hypothetical protein